jgi:hypothetical protein
MVKNRQIAYNLWPNGFVSQVKCVTEEPSQDPSPPAEIFAGTGEQALWLKKQ